MAHLQGSEGAVTDRLRFLLQATRTVWIPERLQTLGIDRNANEATIDLLRVLESEELAEDWISTALRFREQVVLAGPEMVQEAAQRGAVVFEGAQGLLLDQDRGAFPHVTRSNTGIKNVVEIATEAGLEALEITYATRSYLTRHGNGPLPNALPDKPYERAYDNTNKPNTYQGTLRWAHLDLDCLHETIQTDLSDTLGRGLEITTALAVTCADQIDERAIYFHGHQAVYSSKEAFLRDALVSSGLDSLLVSHAPTREGICHYPDAVRL